MRIPRIFDDVAPGSIRIAAFIALSIALHVITVIGSGPLELSAVRTGGVPARTVLHATLITGDDSRPGTPAPDAEKPAPSPDSSSRAETGGAGRGLALPAPDKWYTASEVDVRAEPITEIRLVYPLGLTERVVGTVRVRLYIDEGGVVRKIQIAGAEPPGVFDEAAKQGWQDVRFAPARKNGVAVKSQKLIELTYAPTGGL